MRVLRALLGVLVALVALPASAQDYALRTRVAIDGHGQVLEDVIILVRGDMMFRSNRPDRFPPVRRLSIFATIRCFPA